MNQNERRITRNPGFIQAITNHAKLITRLMIDRRVHFLLKLLPAATLAYLFFPADLMPLLPFDDAAIIWAGTTLFIELCPPEVVAETRRLLEAQHDAADPQTPGGETVDAEYHDV